MMRRLTVAFLALALACDSTEPEANLADLTGLYRLVSLTVDGLTETPPRVSAVMGLVQRDVEDGWAVGGMRFSMRRETPGGHSNGGASGDYSHNARGQMNMQTLGFGYLGEYTLEGDTLVTRLVSEHQRYSIRGVAVWVLDDSL